MLFNMTQRHTGTSRLSASVKNNVLAFRKFQELFANEEKIQRLRDTVANPQTSTAKAATRELDQVVSTFSKLVPFSPASRRSRLGDFMAMLRFFGIPRFFNTVAPDPLGNAAAIRHAFPFVDNRSFPALDDGFADRFRQGASTVKHRLPHLPPTAEPVETSLNLTMTLSRLVSHPIAVAESDRLDTMAMLEHLYGIPATNEVRRTMPVSKRQMGLFGRAFAVAAVTECNGKGWLHNHGLLWSGIPAPVYDMIAHYADRSPELMSALTEFCDAMTRANLPDDLHVQHGSSPRGITERSSPRGIHLFLSAAQDWTVCQLLFRNLVVLLFIIVIVIIKVNNHNISSSSTSAFTAFIKHLVDFLIVVVIVIIIVASSDCTSSFTSLAARFIFGSGRRRMVEIRAW